MSAHLISVTALCDFPANKEFLGRNFNGGERIDLVLKDAKGAWLPYKFVQGVLIHELAHCAEMNHSKAFWKVRQVYHDELKGLWARGYTGEGIWGRGVGLETGEFVPGRMSGAGAELPEHLCGGAYRSQRKRRKNKVELSYKEKKERRIAKKFGVNGQSLGEDEETKIKLEKGRRVVAKPKVAGSVRGRELRAAAALARFEKNEEPKKEESTDSGSETESDDDVFIKVEAIDIDGTRLMDEKGRAVVKVCGDENVEDPDAQDEMAELQGYSETKFSSSSKKSAITQPTPVKVEESKSDRVVTKIAPKNTKSIKINGKPLHDHKASRSKTSQSCKETGEDDVSTASEDEGTATQQRPVTLTGPPTQSTILGSSPQTASTTTEPRASNPRKVKPSAQSCPDHVVAALSGGNCPICSMENVMGAPTCIACANVLDEGRVSGIWRCKSGICRESEYLNCKDVAVCGVCGERRS